MALLVIASYFFGLSVFAQTRATQNVILITLDGIRWQEVFTGADSLLFFRDGPAVEGMWAESAMDRRRLLMPFFWNSVAEEGALFGNRQKGSRVDVTNGHVFSYPGYNEILAGFADPSIDSNDKIPNRNETVLEWINQKPGFSGRVVAYTSWDVFPFIINEERSGIEVNSGFERATGAISANEKLLNQLQVDAITPWDWERFDVYTHHLAFEYLKRMKPRLLYIGYGDTDEFAHADNYEAYLKAIRHSDRFIQALWEWVQSDEHYRNKTTLIVTTDHGRGFGDRWIGHGSDWVGSEAIWIAVLGPDTPVVGEVTSSAPLFQNQIAATVAALLGFDYTAAGRAGVPIEALFK